MREIVGTFVRAETRDEGANSSTQRWDRPGGDLAQERLEFAVGHLDRVKIGGILRQIAKGCARRLDRLAHAGDFVGSKIIDHHDIVCGSYTFASIAATRNQEQKSPAEAGRGSFRLAWKTRPSRESS